MVARRADIKDGIEGRRLTGGGEHRSDTALKLGYFRRHAVVCRVLKSGVKIYQQQKVENSGQLLAGQVFICGDLDYRKHPRLAVFRRIAALHALCLKLKIHLFLPFCSVADEMSHEAEARVYKLSCPGGCFFIYAVNATVKLITFTVYHIRHRV